ncbi:hypothetical protein [Thiocystis violacea]|uniref:hypothetical protein n=1 Tax=Thiocystis violacea TaxID=13725 RepID=UPI001905C232|nr:hypothetical protein [Thiocystis violacea]
MAGKPERLGQLPPLGLRRSGSAVAWRADARHVNELGYLHRPRNPCLLALSVGLFDAVQLERMSNAERAVQVAMAKIPYAVSERLVSADALSDADRRTIVDIGRWALAGFQPQADSKPKVGG